MMAADGGNNITWFTYTGAGGEIIPRDATHIFVDVKTIPARAFYRHHNISEVICHDKVEKLEENAFCGCPRLGRVIMRGVKIAEERAFHECTALTDVECDKLEMINQEAFGYCRSLRSINLPSAEIIKGSAFQWCANLTDVEFSNKLEGIHGGAFKGCNSLERIAIPLKDGIISDDDAFTGCVHLKQVDVVEGVELRKTIAALHKEDWRNDVSEEIDSINQILPNTDAGVVFYNHAGEKAQVIQRWIRSVLCKMVRYKAEHQCVLDVAATTLQFALPRDLVMNNVLSFLEFQLPHRLGSEDHSIYLFRQEDREGEDAKDDEVVDGGEEGYSFSLWRSMILLAAGITDERS